MSEPSKRDSGIDADKLVNRLLDLLQEQQAELAKLRNQIAFIPLGSPKTHDEGDRRDEMIRVDPMAKEIPKQLEGTEPDQEINAPLTVGQTLRRNAVFLGIVMVVAIVTVISAIKPGSAELTRLRSQLHKAQESITSESAVRDSEIISANLELTKLQRKLSDTEKALTDNEKALTEEQQALAQALQLPTQAAPISASPPSIATVPLDPLEQEQKTVTRLYSEVIHGSEELERTKNAYLDNAKELAFNRLAFFNVHLAAQEFSNETNGQLQSAEKKTWDEFLEPDARTLIEANTSQNTGYQIAAPPNTDDIDQLKTVEKHYIDTLKQCGTELRLFQSKILSAQQQIVTTQLQVKNEQARLLTLRNNQATQQPKAKALTERDAGSQTTLEKSVEPKRSN